jgi:putative endopeptidase
MNRALCAAAIAAVVALSGQIEAADNAAQPKIGDWGVDLSAGNTTVKPGDEFYDYVNGAWFAKTQIPSDQASAGVSRDVFNLTQDQLRALIEGSAAKPDTATAAQIGALYKSFMDEAAVEALDAKPLAGALAAIAGAKDKSEFALIMAKSHSGFGMSIFGVQPYADAKKPVTALYVGQNGLGMPDRDYYLTDRFKPKKDAYAAYILRSLKHIDYPNAEAAAKDALAFETQIAEASWAAEERRDIDKIYNPMTVAALTDYAPGIDWRAYLNAVGLNTLENVVALENTAIQKIAKLFQDAPLETLKAWQAFHTVNGAAPFLSKRFVDSHFEFTGKALSGTQELRPRWKRGVSLVEQSLGEAVGREYVAKHFPASSKAQMQDLVANLKVAMAARIRGLEWMAASTKKSALEKLDKMDVMVGYPEKWRDYSTLKIDAKDLYGNVARSGQFELDYQLGKVGTPVDKTEWGMTPQTVNAYNGGLENKIVFPAGILQPPYFDPVADPAVNYGAIGAIIGHEIIHGFDDQGRKIDAVGALRDWWTAEDAKKFNAEAENLSKQYDGYEGAPGMKINGKLTLGENIADLGGLIVALDAYRASLGGKPAPVLNGLTGDQRFFVAFGQAWRGKTRDDALKAQIASDPHSPRRFRVLGPTRNVDDWYAAFDVKPESKYFLAPGDRVRVW